VIAQLLLGGLFHQTLRRAAMMASAW
jgi:hypothetical protein